jgi:hypothetical protein
LEAVMSEQKLGLSGAIESRTAARIGHLLGARLLALGDIARIGSSYRVGVRLVDSETSEIIRSETIEIPVEVFDNEAGRYLTLVPERQAIGIYVFGGYGMMSMEGGSGDSRIFTSYPDPPFSPSYRYSSSIESSDVSSSKSVLGLGIKYFPWPRWMVDLSVIPEKTLGQTGGSLSAIADLDGTPKSYRTVLNSNAITGRVVRLTLNRARYFRKGLNGFVGTGAAFVRIDSNEDKKGLSYAPYVVLSNPSVAIRAHSINESADLIIPMIRAGLEWRPQARFGWAVNGNLNLTTPKYEETVTVQYTQYVQGVSKEFLRPGIVMRRVIFPRFYFDTAVSLYF